jgi:Skp family chaperone for outer membrane proteins
MFTNNKDNRVHISDILLKSDKDTSVPPRASASIPAKATPPGTKKLSKGFLVMVLLICTSAVAAFVIRNLKTGSTASASLPTQQPVASEKTKPQPTSEREAYIYGLREKVKDYEKKENEQKTKNSTLAETVANKEPNSITAVSNITPQKPEDAPIAKTQYQVISRAYFYREPNKNARENTAVTWKKSYTPFNSLAEENGYIYAVIEDDRGGTQEGWLRKKDLKQVRSIMYESGLK